MRPATHIAVCFLLLFLLTGRAGAQYDPLQQLFGHNNPFGKDAITTSIRDATGEVPYLDGFSPLRDGNIFSLDKNSDGAFLVPPGAYTGEFQSFCLHAGTYGPTHGSGYVTAPLKGPSAYLIGRLSQKAANHPEIPQQKLQALIWTIEAHGTIQGDMLKTEYRLLSGKNGVPSAQDALAMIGGPLQFIPAQTLDNLLQKVGAVERPFYIAQNSIRQIAALSGSYEDMERAAVLVGDPPPDKNDRQIPGGRWVYDSKSGAFLRFNPSGYQQTQIETYCPEPFTISYDQAGRIQQIEAGDHSYELTTTYQDLPSDDAQAPHPLSALTLSFAGKVVYRTDLTGSVLTGIPTDASSPEAVHYQQIQDMQREFIGKKARTLTGLVVNMTNYRDGLSAALSALPDQNAQLFLNDFVTRAWIATAYQWINEDKLAVHSKSVSFSSVVPLDRVATFRLAQGSVAPPDIPLSVTGVGTLVTQHGPDPALALNVAGMVATPGEVSRQRLLIDSLPTGGGQAPTTASLPPPFNSNPQPNDADSTAAQLPDGTNTATTQPADCPQYQAMLDEAKEMRELADELETNDEAYEEAIMDILIGGYESDYARYAISGVKDDQIPSLFLDDAAIRAARPKIVARIREKADIRATIATLGLARSGNAPPPAVNAEYTKFASDGVLDYFCSPSPDKMTLEVWTALWAAGYIDYDSFDEIGYQMFSDRLDRAALAASLASFVVEFAARPLFYRLLDVGAARIAVRRAEALQLLTQSKLPAVLPRELDPTWLGRIRGLVESKLPPIYGKGNLVAQPAGKNVGLRWQGKNFYLRVDRGDPLNSDPVQRMDHVHFRFDGRIIGRAGQNLPQGSSNTSEAHIPLADFLSWVHQFALQ